jgi:hypothetical protein
MVHCGVTIASDLCFAINKKEIKQPTTHKGLVFLGY